MIPLTYFNDNYAFAVVQGDHSVIFDCGDGEMIFKLLAEISLVPEILFLTHGHRDHDGGVESMKRHLPDLLVVTPAMALAGEFRSPPGITVEPVHTPGHTMDHICYYLPEQEALITGDTLFAGGCGRCFTGEFMLYAESVTELTALPGETALYGAHEYLAENVKFLKALGRDTAFYDHRLSTEPFPSIGIPLALELEQNPFVKLCHDGEYKRFISLRKEKDSF